MVSDHTFPEKSYAIASGSVSGSGFGTGSGSDLEIQPTSTGHHKLMSQAEIDLEKMGYKQELQREYSKLEIFAVSFSIMSLAPSIASVLVDAIPAGGVGLTWGWLVPMLFVMSVGLSLAEFSSAMPQAGSLYYWTFRLAPEKYRTFLSYFCGWCDAFGLIAGGGSIFYGFALQLLASVHLGVKSYEGSDYETYGVFAAANVLAVVMGYIPAKFMNKLQAATIVMNLVAIGVICIALPVGIKSQGLPINSGSWVFGNQYNDTGYPYGWAFMLAWLSAIWTSSSLESSTHMAEEAKDPETASAFSIMVSASLCTVLGFVIMCIIAAVIDTDPDALNDLMNADLPLANIISRALNDKWSMGIMGLFCVVQYFMGQSSVLATSRMIYAFARDKAIPGHKFWSKVDARGIPLPGLLFTTLVSCLLGLLILAGSTAANALFSLGITALYMAWSIPIWLRTIFFDENSFKPGKFYLGHRLSWWNNVVASLFGLFVTFPLTMIPTAIPVTSADDMNWTVVVCFGFWILFILDYVFRARHKYIGPISTLSDGEFAEVLDAVETNAYEKRVHQKEAAAENQSGESEHPME